MTTFTAISSVPTASASRYLQQLCKHWQHDLAVEFTPEHGTIVIPKDVRGADFAADGLITLDAGATLEVRLHASSTEQLALLKVLVSSHLDRFAFREAPLSFDWQAG